MRAGDVTGDDVTDAADIDGLAAAIRDDATLGDAAAAAPDPRFDLNGDGTVDYAGDVTYLVETILGTRFGDTNLDRRVGVSDLSTFALHFGTEGVGWATGDLNGDRRSSVADLSLLALNFGFDGTDPANPLPGAGLFLAEAAALGGINLSAVPEPAAAAVLLFTPALAGRTSRSRRRPQVAETGSAVTSPAPHGRAGGCVLERLRWERAVHQAAVWLGTRASAATAGSRVGLDEPGSRP